MDRNVYLKMKTLTEAQGLMASRFSRVRKLAVERLAVPDAVGRVLAEPVSAKLSSPNFHAAAMDGVAVKAETTFGASETRPKNLMIDREAYFLNTGHVMPHNTDAVIMIENVNILDDKHIQIEAPVFPWQNVRKVGEDIVATELLFPQKHRITPYCVGALLAGGIFSVSVLKKPNILIIPTGSELIDWRDCDLNALKPGQVLETNSFVLGKLIESSGGTYTRANMLSDDLEDIKAAVANAVDSEFDMVLVIGGSSAGSEDYAKTVITDLGEVIVHGVTIMPGKPVLIGTVENTPVFGIPGYPVSAIIAYEQFVGPLIHQLLGQPQEVRTTVRVKPTRKIASKLGVEEFLRVKLGQVDNHIVATPLPRGAGCITSITEADGIIRIPNHVEGLQEQDSVTAELLRPLPSIRDTIVIVGSHDNSLDVLADQLRADYGTVTLSSSHVGSMGGLMALKRGMCHLAGSHLLDTQDGSYNISWVKRYLPAQSAKDQIRLIQLVLRDQGLIVAKNNPKGIKGIKDLCREDIRFINRQGGSGTRILLDYRLDQMGIDPATINGYEDEEFTHMSVAVAVLSQTVDVGLGIYAAAKALNLDFIPVVTEQYDLIVPQKYFEAQNIQRLLETIRTKEFKQRVDALGGYSTQKTGEIIL